MLCTGFMPIILATITIGGLLPWIGKTGATMIPQNSIVNDTKRMGVCELPECLKMDQNLMSKVDRTLNPCDDFYEYVCKNYVGSATESMSKPSEIDGGMLTVEQKAISIVQEPVKSTDTRALQMMKQMYQTCEGRYSDIQELRNLIEYVGGWSLLENKWNESDFSLDKFFARSIEKGYLPTSLFTFNLFPDFTNTTLHNMFVITRTKKTNNFIKKTSEWPVKSPTCEELPMVDDYLLTNFSAKISDKMGICQIEVEKQLVEFIRMKGLIDAMFLEDVYFPGALPKNFTTMTLTQLQVGYRNIPWNTTLRGILGKRQIPKNETFFMSCSSCFSSLNDFLASVPTRSLSNFLIWTLIIDLVRHADTEMFEHYSSFTSSDPLAEAKKLHCRGEVFSTFRKVLDYEYVERHFDKSLIPEVTSFIGFLKSTMKDTMNASHMLDEETRKYAIQKLDAMISKVGYDDEISNKSKVDEYYAQLYIDSKQYFKSFLNVTIFGVRKYFEGFGKPATHYTSATEGNAAYHILLNTIEFSLPVLGDFFFSKNRPQYLNFGALGFGIAHEMNHGFDERGRTFDGHGLLHDWWQPEALKNYEDNEYCLVEQYSQYVNIETGNKVNGIRTLFENQADHGGALVAYEAYVKWSKNGEQELPLPSFQEFSPRQMFWLTFASLFCSKISYNDALIREQTDIHALDRIRVIGVVSNSVDFAKDFNCKAGSPMNPKDKCLFW